MTKVWGAEWAGTSNNEKTFYRRHAMGRVRCTRLDCSAVTATHPLVLILVHCGCECERITLYTRTFCQTTYGSSKGMKSPELADALPCVNTRKS